MTEPHRAAERHDDVHHCDLAIIGRGMIGSAAARHAAKITRDDSTIRIVLIGPSEPSKQVDSLGDDTSFAVFGAHYDEGRITRRTDPDPIWAELASRSIGRYSEISRSANEFYSDVGHLAVGLEDSEMMNRRRDIAKVMGVQCRYLDEAELQSEFPNLSFPQGCVALHEKQKSGY